MTSDHERVPISPEQWLSFVIALQSQRSSNQGQREFGNRLFEIVFERIPNRSLGDAVANAYFDNILAEVAWAVRGFSVVRDIYGTNVNSIEKANEIEMRRVEALQRLSPFASDSFWGKIKGALLGIGLASPLFAVTSKWFGNSAPAILITAAVVLAFGLVFVELGVSIYVSHKLRSLQSAMPGANLEMWRTKALAGYKSISLSFLTKIFAIERRYYPSDSVITFSEDSKGESEILDEIIGRAFSIESAFEP